MSFKKVLPTILILLMLSAQAFSQVAINTTGAEAEASAMLDISSTEKGMLAPRMTTVQRTAIASPANGLLVYDTDTKSFWHYNNDDSLWVELVPGAIELNDLSDAKADWNSVFIGEESGINNNGGTYSSAIGYGSLRDLTTGIQNTAIGYIALLRTETGERNTAIGYRAMVNNLTGGSNIAIGIAAYAGDTDGDSSTFVGTKSGFTIDGDKNCGYGYGSLAYIDGDRNTAIGSLAGYGDDAFGSSTSYNGCVFLGYEAGRNNTDDNKLYIENSDSQTPLIGGDFDANQVDINGTIKITGGSPGVGKVLTSDADGLASWEENPGATVLNDLGDAISDGSNLFLGTNAGINDEGYNNNTGIGKYSLNENINGESNVAIGRNSLLRNIEGDSNTFVGNYSGEWQFGNRNTGIGFGNMRYNDFGNDNTVLGYNAGRNEYMASPYSGCILIGYEAGKNNTSNNKLYIENSDSDSPLIGGDFDADQVDINGTIKITGGTPGNGKVLTSDADGLSSWQTPSTYASELNDLSDAITDGTSVFIGTNSGVSNSGTDNRNTSVGYHSLRDVTTGHGNTALGYNGLKWNTTGSGNTAIGQGVLINNSTGNNNTVLGYYAGYGTTDNQYNGCVFLGYYAGHFNTSDDKLYIENSSSENPLIGGDFSTNQVDINGTIKITGGTPGNGKVLTSDADGLSSWQTPSTYASDINSLSDAIYNGSDLFLGNGAGESNSGTNNNVAVGRDALKTSTSNDYNTAVGNLSLELSTGERNTAIGYFSMHSNTSGSFNTSLGYRTGYDNQTGSNNTFIGYNARMTNSTIRVNSTAIGNDAVITGSDQVRIGNSSVTSIGGQVSWSTLSDGRFKENVKEDVAGLDFVLNLRPVSYTVNKQAFKSFVGSEYQSDNKTSSQRECGFVAQEVEELIQKTGVEFNGVDAPENSDDYYGIRYSQFVIPLVKSVQELNEKLEKENTELKTQNAEMLQRIEKLEEILLKK